MQQGIERAIVGVGSSTNKNNVFLLGEVFCKSESKVLSLILFGSCGDGGDWTCRCVD